MSKEITDDQRAAMATAVDEIGGHKAVADLLGYPDLRNVYPWTSGRRPLPPEHGPNLEYGSHGLVTVERLCPDHKWVRVRDRKWPHPQGRPCLDTATAAAKPVPAKA